MVTPCRTKRRLSLNALVSIGPANLITATATVTTSYIEILWPHHLVTWHTSAARPFPGPLTTDYCQLATVCPCEHWGILTDHDGAAEVLAFAS